MINIEDSLPNHPLNGLTIYIYIYVIYWLRGPDEKNCARGLEMLI